MNASLAIFILLFLLAAPARADHAVNINTASLEELKTLDGVGDSIAQSIIANRPYTAIEQVSRATGIGEPGSSSYEKIKNHITVSSTPQTPTTPNPPAQNQTETQTQTQTPAPVAGGAPVPALTVKLRSAAQVSAGAGSWFEGDVYGTEGETIVQNVRYFWNFGDGVTAEGRSAQHTYAYPGNYMVVLSVSHNYSSGAARLLVEATAPQAGLQVEGDGSLTIVNRGSQELDVSGWSIRRGPELFVVPEESYVLARGGVRFSPVVLGFSGDRSSKLYFPNGVEVGAGKMAASAPQRGVQVAPAELSLQRPTGSAQQRSVADQILPTANADAGEVLGAAHERGNSSLMFWGSLASLAVVIGAGIMGAHYVRPRAISGETEPTADEFDIEHDQ